uniref:Reverse transcriptase domain-containing protein n=1 Tax=Tanacetum cinerariifolium TaxID=118510 RepID=A0A6L2JRT7_TANCI|nr:reverse transcriptase domain-containing protein [Tanacetum cinerariifolium]
MSAISCAEGHGNPKGYPTYKKKAINISSGSLKQVHLIQEHDTKYPNSHLFGPNKIRPKFCINKLAPSVGPNTRDYSKKISAMANTTPFVTTVTKPATNPRDADATPRVNILDFCEEYYEDILPIIMDKVRHNKRKEVHDRLDFGEGSRERRTREGSHYLSARTLFARPERLKVRDRLRYNDRHVLDRLCHRRQSAFDRLSETYSPSTTKSRPDKTSSKDRSHGRSRAHRRDASNGDRPKSKDCFCGVGESYDKSHSSYGTGINHGYRYRDRDHSRHTKRGTDSESPLSSVSKSNSKVDPFTSRIRNFKTSRKTRTPNNVKTYDGTGDPEDHVKFFQAAAQVERCSMPTWCHMFNSTLIGAAKVWFDELPSKSIDSYKDLKAAFLTYFMQQKKYVKDPVKIHNIKQKDGETIEEFIERFKVETGRMKGALECMRIFGLMHGVNNLELTKRLNEHVSKTMKKMMITTTTFIRGEAAAASKKKGHSTDECMQLKKQIEELVRAGKLSHLIKEIKHGRDQSKVGKKEALAKDKPTKIYMIQSWQRTTRKKVTRSFERVREITFPSLATSSGTEGPLVIEAKIGGHMIHRMYVDGGDADHSTRAWMNFMIVRSLSPYNGIIGRPGIKEIQAVPSTAHGMLKFPADGGIVTLRSTILIPAECATVITSSKEIPKEAGVLYQNFKVALHPNFQDQEVAIGGPLSAKGRTKLCSLLKENLDIFAWQPSDMTRVPRSVAEHRLNIREGYLPVRQKKIGHAPKRAKAIQVEVQKLAEAEIIREVYYHDWLSNPVMSAKSDEEKTTFHTGQGVYCYIKMPFGLKNAGATYQRLVDKAFDNQIVEGMFLGYMITPNGIKSCPDKTEVVLQLPSPRTIKEVQSLNGMLASLNRFLSKSAEKSLPFFKTLKKCIKKSDFHWTSEAKQAFKQLKQHLSELPLLVAPKLKEELIVYMSASYGAISAVLMTEIGLVQTLYYLC